jgi:hypothetical protein
MLAGRDDWPTWREMRAAGHSGLMQHLNRKGTRAAWARKYGVHPQSRRPPPRRWTDDTISAALDELLAGRDDWPTRREMRAAGFYGLSQHLGRTGTQAQWARKYGVRNDRCRRSLEKH